MKYVKVWKINSGVNFQIVNSDGRIPARLVNGNVSRAESSALALAEEWYRRRVNESFLKNGIHDSGYADEFRRKFSRYDGHGLKSIELEPWGFALPGPDGSPIMGDTGSTPTTARALILSCYQEPLDSISDGKYVRFEKLLKIGSSVLA